MNKYELLEKASEISQIAHKDQKYGNMITGHVMFVLLNEKQKNCLIQILI